MVARFNSYFLNHEIFLILYIYILVIFLMITISVANKTTNLLNYTFPTREIRETTARWETAVLREAAPGVAQMLHWWNWGWRWQTNEELSAAPCCGIIRWMIQLRVTVERTICEVRGVERQPAAQVLVNPPAGLEEIFALQTEGKRWDFQGGNAAPAAEQGRTGAGAPSTGHGSNSSSIFHR